MKYWKHAVFALGLLGLTGCGADGLCLVDYARGTVTVVAPSSLLDTDNFDLGNGLGTIKIEFDKAGDGPTAADGRVALDISALLDTPEAVRDALVTAINSAGAGITATAGTGGLVNLTNDLPGSSGNVPIVENVADPGFTVTGMSGGCP